ncbi:MAG: hypothetical protein VXY93_06480 [Pseudomonadota bacterium]|nr:hypothetical protein [Pseudomonadota bacterium]|tara:strand:- start:204 stop:575 length:372 start_codon:yes stop_codon:yes gene_type:complete
MMDIFNELNDENFTLFAIKHYNNPQCLSTEEFYEDIRRFRYLKRLLKRYYKNGELRERLILNHIIILSNLFGVSNAIRMLKFKIEMEYWPVIKTCLLYLGYVEEDFEINIPIDMEVAKILREL